MCSCGATRGAVAGRAAAGGGGGGGTAAKAGATKKVLATEAFSGGSELLAEERDDHHGRGGEAVEHDRRGPGPGASLPAPVRRASSKRGGGETAFPCSTSCGPAAADGRGYHCLCRVRMLVWQRIDSQHICPCPVRNEIFVNLGCA